MKDYPLISPAGVLRCAPSSNAILCDDDFTLSLNDTVGYAGGLILFFVIHSSLPLNTVVYIKRGNPEEFRTAPIFLSATTGFVFSPPTIPDGDAIFLPWITLPGDDGNIFYGVGTNGPLTFGVPTTPEIVSNSFTLSLKTAVALTGDLAGVPPRLGADPEGVIITGGTPRYLTPIFTGTDGQDYYAELRPVFTLLTDPFTWSLTIRQYFPGSNHGLIQYVAFYVSSFPAGPVGNSSPIGVYTFHDDSSLLEPKPGGWPATLTLTDV